ncbi:MAG: glycoside hydrolase family 65 protein [Thermodesulfobacteriota bacterium]
MTVWSLIYEGFKPDEEDLREALCTLGNGYFATRGAAPERQTDDIHYPGTYLAGGYNRLKTDIAGRTIENEDLVNLPNWLLLTFSIDGGKWFDLRNVEILAYRQELDLKRGLLLRTIRFRDKQDRQTELKNRRLVHMAEPHLAALETTITAENWSGLLEMHSALDGRVINDGVERYKSLNSKHLEAMEAGVIDEERIYLKVQTNQSELRIAQAAKTRLFHNGKPLSQERKAIQEQGYIGQEFGIEMSPGSCISVEKVVALFTSRDPAISECGLEAKKTIREDRSFASLLQTHSRAWQHLWRRFTMEFHCKESKKDKRMRMILHLYVFHLLQTASINTMTMGLDVGVPSRGWHGEAYRGHIFWDELFIFPLINLRLPEITKALLMYRYRRMNEARAAAKESGYLGAMYPWQSGSNGREESQQLHLNPKSGRWLPDNSHLQRHVNVAIAYNIWQYYQATGDLEFLSFYGAEVFLEIARFWGSIATYNDERKRYEILGVMGPDEYHDGYPNPKKPGLNNNAYTNIMAVWVLTRADEIVNLVPEDRREELFELLDLRQEEIDRWRDISRTMFVPFHGDGIISQFEGYDDLEEFDWEGYRKKYEDIQRLDRILEAENDTPNRYKASKQADVLMLFYLLSAEELAGIFENLGYPFEYETIPNNIDYYLHRTSHGSTLSRVVHSWVLVRSDRARSWKLFTEALESDVADIQGGTTPEGIHLGAMAGVANLIQRGYTGIDIRDDVLWFNPCLPEEVESLQMEIRYRGHSLEVEITGKSFRVRSMRCAETPISIGYKDTVVELGERETREFSL